MSADLILPDGSRHVTRPEPPRSALFPELERQVFVRGDGSRSFAYRLVLTGTVGMPETTLDEQGADRAEALAVTVIIRRYAALVEDLAARALAASGEAVLDD